MRTNNILIPFWLDNLIKPDI